MENVLTALAHRKHLLALAKSSTQSSGVYLLMDDSRTVLYIGKAKNLRNRLQSYFVPEHLNPRIEWMVKQVQLFELILTQTEVEALILEATLIKKYKPQFNIRLKDNKSYPYLKIVPQQDYPQLELTRKVLKDQARYFGPFPSSWAVRQMRNLLTEHLKLRDCSDNTFHYRKRPCILYEINKCSAPCVNLVSRQAYHEKISEAITILEGKSNVLFDDLEQKMQQAAEKEDYETAAELRDKIYQLKWVTQSQGVVNPQDRAHKDVIGFVQENHHAYVVVLAIRHGKCTSVHHFYLQHVEDAPEEVLYAFLKQYYITQTQKEALQEPIAEKVLITKDFPERDLLEQATQLKFVLPITAYDEQLLSVAKNNAVHGLAQKSKAVGSTEGFSLCKALQLKLHLPTVPIRIECFDISNFQSFHAVGSRVVFIEGRPEKSLYRRYKIRDVTGQNDFAMLKEVLLRRFSRSEEPLPDLIIVDGGKGQLTQAHAILKTLGLEHVTAVGLAKARTESDFLSTELKGSVERIFCVNRKNPILLKSQESATQLVTALRDEAHRFALRYHRFLREKISKE